MAERLRARRGADLDDSAISAIAEVAGASEDFVRLIVNERGQGKVRLHEKWRAGYLSLRPDYRQYVASAVLGGGAGISYAVCLFTDALARTASNIPNVAPVFNVAKLAFILGGLFIVARGKDLKGAIVSGAILAGAGFGMSQILQGVFRFTTAEASDFLWIYLLFGAFAGAALHTIWKKAAPAIGVSDGARERQELLRQLVDLQEQLRSGEQAMTFLSVDIVGSTKMKETADPLNVEFTFTEYHKYVELVAGRFGGRIHSTAGDGVICAFEGPGQAFGAGKNMQSGLFEFNTFRNKVGRPISLRVGIHAGKVVTPDAGDVTSVNFAHVIDVAAHVQKVCPPGSVAVSEDAAVLIPGGKAKVGSQEIDADDCRIVIWAPKTAVAAASAGGPPKPPSV